MPVLYKNPKIYKGKRHSKIIGTFGEWLVANWLSRSGFEVAIVDQTGIDIVAYNRQSNRRLGITVKSRTRAKGQEGEAVNLFKKKTGDLEKVKSACSDFRCEPWIAVYVEGTDSADLFLTEMGHYLDSYKMTQKKILDWKMGKRCTRRYDEDTKVSHVTISFDTKHWVA